MAGKSRRVRTAAGLDEQPDQPRQAIRVAFVGRRNVAAQLEGLLAGEAISVTALTNQKAALRLLRTDPPHALLVEIDARPDTRLRFCATVRGRLPTLAILAVGAEPPRTSFAFDGFLSLPLSRQGVDAALARIRDRSAGHVLQRGPFRLNLATRTLDTPRGTRHLTPKQSALLELLMRRHDEVVHRREIMAAIWETSYLDDTRTLDVHIRWLRECIEQDPSSPLYLLTVRGQGYTFQAQACAPA
jgi:DNA-binding response OmpR family regulator